MKKEDLSPGDAVWLKHDDTTTYTFLGESAILPNIKKEDYIPIYKAELGVFAYNPGPNRELRMILLPFSAVNKA
jgi:hypothetical protein